MPPPDISVRGIRGPIPPGYVLGRQSAGMGPPELISLADLTTPLQNQVTSVFGRGGAVVATTGDYSVGQVTGAAPINNPVFTGIAISPIWVAGTNASRPVGAFTPLYQVHGIGGAATSMGIAEYGANAACGSFVFYKTRSLTVGGANVALNSGDALGVVRFYGDDGTATPANAAAISVLANAAWSSGANATRLEVTLSTGGPSAKVFTIDPTGIIIPKPNTVAGLPAATQGGRGMVTDSNAAHAAGLGNIVAGGGANIVPVYADGTNWRIG